MITRSYCSSWTCSIILQSMQYLRSNPQDTGNPNIPWSCTTLLQSSQSAASGHISVPHTRQPHPWVRGVKGSAEFLVGEKEDTATSCWGKNPTHSPNKKHIGLQFRVRSGINNNSYKKEKKESNHPKPNWASWGKQKIDRHRKWSWKSKWKCNLDFHFKRFEVSGTHLVISLSWMWPKLK